MDDSASGLGNLHKNRTKLKAINNASSVCYGNSFIKSNKSDIISILGQGASGFENSNIYTNKYGIIISEDGPFWPQDFRILHPTPKLLSREVTPKEFYLTVADSSSTSKLKK